MSEERDPFLQSLFAEHEDLAHENFLEGVRREVRRQETLRLLFAGLLIAVLIVTLWLLSEPLYAAAATLTLTLTAPIIELGDGLFSLMLSPLNNLASILILIARLGWLIWKRIRHFSYV